MDRWRDTGPLAYPKASRRGRMRAIMRKVAEAATTSRQEAHVRVADRQPAGPITVGQRREQEAGCGREDQSRRFGRTGGGIARRPDALQHEIVAAAERLRGRARASVGRSCHTPLSMRGVRGCARYGHGGL